MPVPAGPSDLPSWAPSLSEVADYCTARTLVPQPDGSNLEVDSFTASTRPTDTQVNRIIADACGWVTLKCGTLDASLGAAGNSVAAQRSAGFIELRFPERSHLPREDAIATAKELLKEADKARDDLQRANELLTGEDPTDAGVAVVLPYWSFPEPSPVGDLTL